jgi:deoxycytidylate deaminase
MKKLSGLEWEVAHGFLSHASKVADKSTCSRSKCGSVIVEDFVIIGSGYNSPPGSMDSQRRCLLDKEQYHKKVTDKTCCVHAEQRAVLDALAHNPARLQGSTIYFARLGSDGKISASGKPYCTICSKLCLDVGIAKFVLRHEEGIFSYEMEEYNDISFKYKG